MVALLGQHRELVTNALSKVVPLSMSSDFKLGMCCSVFAFRSFTVRSSVRIKTLFGGLGFSFLSSFVVASPDGKEAASVKQAASSKREGEVMARTLLTRMVGLPVWFAPAEGLRKAQAGFPPLVVV